MPADVIQGSFPPEAVRRLAAARGAAPGTPNARAGSAVQASPRGSGVPAWPLPSAAPIGRRAGQRLPAPVQRKMERLLGASFADVQVHVGPEAAALGAYAFTRGSHLYFAPGRYAPDTPAGQRLLAHELTHVLQQRAGRVRNPFGRGVAVVHDPALEAEAERNGLRALAQPVSRPSAPPGAAGTVQRAPRPGSTPGSRSPARGSSTRRLPGGAKRFRATASGVVQRGPIRSTRSDRSRERDERSPYSLRRREDKNRRSGRTRSVKPTAPTVPGWKKIMWDGRSRLPWDNPGQHVGQECETCADGGDDMDAEAMDHIVPFRVYIFKHANPETFCDGVNHWSGIPYDEARELYNDPKNLRPLCKPCNSTKAPQDRDNPANTENAPVYEEPCPGIERCGAVPLYKRG